VTKKDKTLYRSQQAHLALANKAEASGDLKKAYYHTLCYNTQAIDGSIQSKEVRKANWRFALDMKTFDRTDFNKAAKWNSPW